MGKSPAPVLLGSNIPTGLTPGPLNDFRPDRKLPDMAPATEQIQSEGHLHSEVKPLNKYQE